MCRSTACSLLRYPGAIYAGQNADVEMHIIGHLRRLAHPDTPVEWRISAPFVFSIELGRRGEDGAAQYPLDLAAWRTVIARIAPFAEEVFLEGEEPLGHPEVLPLLALCDELGFRYHVTSLGKWPEPRLLVNRLRALKRLGTLRICLPAIPESEAAALANLKFAVAAGLDVWALLSMDAVDPERLPDRVARLHALGAKGIAFFRGRATNQLAYERAAELRQAGYHLALEDCAPPVFAGRLPGRCRGLLGSCFVSAQGEVLACRHSPVILGNLLNDGIEAIWSGQKAESLRSRLTGGQGTSSNLYLCGCPFEEMQENGAVEDTGTRPLNAGSEAPAAELDPSLVPVPRYCLRRQPFGAVLIKDYDFIPISHAGRRIAEAFDGRHTLRELRRRFGQQAVLMAYALFCEKMLRFSRERAGAEEDLPAPPDEEADA
jgi:hypothetical protein